MGYNIEISFDLTSQHTSVSETKAEIADLALSYECDYYYYLYEMEGGGKHGRNHCVMVINFDDVQIPNCAAFLKHVKRMKNKFSIECIYEDDIECKLIYASSCYQTSQMDRANATKYNKFKRERSLSDNERLLLDFSV
jgi:hypothetical protein